MTPENSARAAARRIVEEVLAEHASRGGPPTSDAPPAGTGRSVPLEVAREPRPDTEAWRAAQRIVDQTLQEHAARAVAPPLDGPPPPPAEHERRPVVRESPPPKPPEPPEPPEPAEGLETAVEEPAVQKVAAPPESPPVAAPIGPPPVPGAANVRAAPEPANVPPTTGLVVPSPDAAPDAPTSIAARIVAEVLAARDVSRTPDRESEPRAASELRAEPEPELVPAGGTLVLDSGDDGDDGDDGDAPLFAAVAPEAERVDEAWPEPTPEPDPEPAPEPEALAEDEFGAWPEPDSPPRRTGRWLVTTILGALALAWLLPLAIGALRDLVSLSS